MTKKLLTKSTRSLLIFSILLLFVAAPAFYFIAAKLYIDETDETLTLQKEEFLTGILPHFKTREITAWNKYNRNVQILADIGTRSDTLFTKTYFDKLENENEPYRELNAPIKIDGKIYTFQGKINLIEKEDMVLGIALLFVLVISLLLTGILLINKIASERLWAPFYNTLDQMQDFEIDKNKEPQFALTDIEEFSRLNKSLERLIVKNTVIYKSQREFVENAAHELQTPLALFQAKIDTLSQSANISKEDSALLGSIHNDIGRLNRLNKNLLLLSKIENDNYQDKQVIVVNEFLKRNIDFFIEQAKSKNLTLFAELNETISITSNPALVEVLINNLFLNAIRHNIKDGKISVTIADRSLTFQNTGPGKSLDREKLFNRFSKSDSSSRGNGLGLAIVKKIVEMNAWKLQYHFEDNLHNFKVLFS